MIGIQPFKTVIQEVITKLSLNCSGFKPLNL